MGKNLKGKDCGKGIYQRKDGLYSARFVDKAGKRHEKIFRRCPKRETGLRTQSTPISMTMCLSLPIRQWMNGLNSGLKILSGIWLPTRSEITGNAMSAIFSRFIGKMLIANVKPMHCKKVFIQMDADYAGSTIRQAYITMGTMFKAAKMNDLIAKHPMDGVRFSKPVRAVDDIHYLTREEQRLFLETARRSHNYNQYALILETGLRTGEMIGLTWDAIDFERRTLMVNKTLEFRHAQKVWRAGPPKTQQSYRTIPLTDKAYDILKEVWDSRSGRKESPLLSQTLEYMDRRTGVTFPACDA